MSNFEEILSDLREENSFYYKENETAFFDNLDKNKLGNLIGTGQFSKYVYDVRIVLYDNFIANYGDVLIKFALNQLATHKYGALSPEDIKTLKCYVVDFYNEKLPNLIQHIKDYYEEYPIELGKINTTKERFQTHISKIENKLSIELNRHNAKSKNKGV